MNSVLSSRLKRLEAMKGMGDKEFPRVVRLVVRDEDVLKAKEEARAMGFDPDGDELLIIRLMVPAHRRAVLPGAES